MHMAILKGGVVPFHAPGEPQHTGQDGGTVPHRSIFGPSTRPAPVKTGPCKLYGVPTGCLRATGLQRVTRIALMTSRHLLPSRDGTAPQALGFLGFLAEDEG